MFEHRGGGGLRQLNLDWCFGELSSGPGFAAEQLESIQAFLDEMTVPESKNEEEDDYSNNNQAQRKYIMHYKILIPGIMGLGTTITHGTWHLALSGHWGLGVYIRGCDGPCGSEVCGWYAGIIYLGPI